MGRLVLVVWCLVYFWFACSLVWVFYAFWIYVLVLRLVVCFDWWLRIVFGICPFPCGLRFRLLFLLVLGFCILLFDLFSVCLVFVFDYLGVLGFVVLINLWCFSSLSSQLWCLVFCGRRFV